MLHCIAPGEILWCILQCYEPIHEWLRIADDTPCSHREIGSSEYSYRKQQGNKPR